MADQTVAKTILQQLGGGRFLAMTGASNLISTENSLGMKLPRIAAKKITHLRIELVNDLYNVTFMNCRTRPTLKQEVIESIDGVYAEDLQRIFTETTGLDTRF